MATSTSAHMPGMMSTLIFSFLFAFFFGNVSALGATDTITWGGDNSRTGYQPNHNMDPSVVGSSQFGQLFKTLLPGNYNGAVEQIYASPLVYTTSDGVQYLYVATTQNNLYKINAKTGTIVMQRNLHIPFLVADLGGCTDINPLVGVTSTGVIDPDTDTLYLTSKTYADQTQINVAQGRPAGRYYLHAINVNDLTERPNFPVNLEGIVARNNPSRSFNGGIHHQRPALLHTGQYIYAGFASHCVQWNFTGWMMGWDKTTGQNVERFAMEGSPVPNTTPGAGVWMSGGGLASDDAGSIFFGSGNGYASQLSTIPVNGRNPPSALEEAAVHMTIGSDGSLTVVDFFMPWEKQQLDGADKDLGTTPLEMLPSEFSCGDYKRIGVITGKSGKTYWLNLDDLGGYRNGPNQLDDIIQVYQNENSVYAGAGVYPGEGGYIYINVIQYPTHVFKFSCNAGVPSFTKVADSPTNNAFVLGTGHGTVTSLNGAPGTGLLWTSDVQGYNLRIYNAVPQNGVLTQINQFNAPGITKFSRPVFGDGRAYLSTNLGYIYGFGSPVNLPLNCTSPLDFGTSNLNNATSARTVTCTANVGVTITNVTLTGDANFVISGVPAVPATVAAGAAFSFQAAFNPKAVGPQSSDVVISTTNGVAGYSISTPVSLRGTGQSVTALLQVSPLTLTFPGVVAGNDVVGVNQTVLFTNLGNAPLTISEIKYSIKSETGPFIPANGTASAPQAGPFTFYNLPSTIPGNSGVSVIVNFNTSATGNFAAYLNVVSNGGTKIFDVLGTAGSAPVAVLEFQTPDGLGWVPYQKGVNFTFGNVTEQNTRYLKMRLTNNATADGAHLSLTVSKPPFGLGGIIGASNQVDLVEGTTLAPGENATATLYCSVPKSQWNVDPYPGSAQWTMNVNDLTFGKQNIMFFCGAISEQAPPLQPNGLGYYRYTGCFKENNPGRQLQQQLYGSPNDTQLMCIAACNAAGYTFCGNQYNRECWGGNTIPVLKVDEGNCNFPCTGDTNQICGGNGITGGGAYMSLFADSRTFNGNTTTPPVTGPFVNPGVRGFTSLGCYAEPSNGRALAQQITVANKTIATCVAGCIALGTNYIYAGMEYGGECWCGTSLNSGSLPAPATDCSMTCKDNATEYCGAGSRLNLYSRGSAPTTLPVTSSVTSTTISFSGTPTGSSTSTTIPATTTRSSTSSTTAPTASSTGPAANPSVSGYAFQGCYNELTVGGRALSSKTYANDSMTIESCAAFCSGFQYFGVEYGRECYCGATLASGSTLVANQADCNFLCPGDKTEYCGAGNRIQLYKIASSASSSTTSSSNSASSTQSSSSAVTSSSSSLSTTSSSSSFASSISSSSSSAATSSSSSVTSTSSSSSLPISVTSSSSSSSSSSASSSSSSSSSALSSSSSSTLSSSSSSSSFSSSILSTSSTSSSSSISSTSTSATPSPSPTGPSVSQGNANFTYYSCVSEPSNGRLLSNQVLNNGTGMTIELCLSVCSQYAYAGVEYGRECWCGNTLNIAGNAGGTPSANVSDSDCSFLCPGNSSEYCGAGVRLSLYWFDTVKAKSNGQLKRASRALESAAKFRTWA